MVHLCSFRFDEDLRNVMPWAKSQWSHTDLKRLKMGRVSAQVCNVFQSKFHLNFSFAYFYVLFDEMSIMF